MKKLLLFLTISIFLYGCSKKQVALSPDAFPGSIPDLTGNYIVNGIDQTNFEYGGYLTITKGKNQGEYNLQWIIMESIQQGFGQLEGNQLLAEWNNIDDPYTKYSGTVIYTITEKKELYGTRTVNGRVGEGQEIAYPDP